MKYNLQLILLFIIQLSLPTCDSSRKTQGIPVEKIISEPIVSSFQTITGKPIDLKTFQGKRIFLNFWATYCKPCIQEMPEIEELAKTLEQENYVFLLASDEPVSKIQEFVDKNNFELDFIRFGGNIDDWNIYATPTTLIYNTKGEIVKRFVGVYEWNSKEILSSLREIE